MLFRPAIVLLSLSVRAIDGQNLRDGAGRLGDDSAKRNLKKNVFVHKQVRPDVEAKSCKEDGGDCTSDRCAKLADEQSRAETCENVAVQSAGGRTIDITAINAVTNPQFASPVPPTEPFCVRFNDDTEDFGPCPSFYDNIDVNPSGAMPYADDPTNPLSADHYLHLKDESGGSLACGTGSEYTGDWTSLSSTTCRELCFDVKLFYDGCHSGVSTCTLNGTSLGYYIEIFPKIILQGGAPEYLRAVFVAHDFMTDEDGSSPEWRRICAPLEGLNSTGQLPSNEFGRWVMAAPNNILGGGPPVPSPASPDSMWPTLLSDVTAIQLPIDFTGNPAERAGYDNICLHEKDCEDYCEPEPLCYWQHEWDCKAAKDEQWYGNFTELVSPLETFPKKFCICKVLDECCADLCDLAEQEFMALLLNIASGQLSPDCGVRECDDCLHNITSVVSIVDELLAPSSRSDYDCSKALQYLTGINLDEILCDSVTVTLPDPCPQTDECLFNKGTCVSADVCVPSETVICEDHYCGSGDGSDCTCEMKRPCPQTKKCEAEGGRCIKNCLPTADGSVKCVDLCSEDGSNGCMCEIKAKPCKQTTLCDEKRGRCVKKEDCHPPFSCLPQLCDLNDGCVCKVRPPSPCIDHGCQVEGGECVRERDCVPIPGVRKCVPDLCTNEQDPDSCTCKIEEKCSEVDPDCEAFGGSCTRYDQCDQTDPSVVCNPGLCGSSDICVCKHPAVKPSLCKDVNNKCAENKGECVKKCVEIPGIQKCISEFCDNDLDPDLCACKINRCTDDGSCANKGGECKASEECDSLNNVCDPDLCSFGDSCVCEYPMKG